MVRSCAVAPTDFTPRATLYSVNHGNISLVLLKGTSLGLFSSRNRLAICEEKCEARRRADYAAGIIERGVDSLPAAAFA
jgi:hypothetical protein